MNEAIKEISEKIATFKRRYYLNLILRGAILMPSWILGYFLIAALLEYNLWLGSTARFLIFFLSLALAGFSFLYFFGKPLKWWIYDKGLGQEESAKMIGNQFPAVADRLVNIIQLASSKKKGILLEASIAQKSKEVEPFHFEKAIDLGANKKYLRYLVLPLGLIIILIFVDSTILTESSDRIIRFNQEFSPEAPFQFKLLNQNLSSFFNEDFIIELSLEGKAIPESAYINTENQRWKMEWVAPGRFQYTFEKLQHALHFQIEASGFYSSPYSITIVNRPEVTQLKTLLNFPPYILRHSAIITNAGNLEVPEGTQITWQVKGAYTSKAEIHFTSQPNLNLMKLSSDQTFTFSKNFYNPDQYTVLLENKASQNKDRIAYPIMIIKDQYPQILIDNLQDTILFRSIQIGGVLKDDYGISRLVLNFQIETLDSENKTRKSEIAIAKGKTQQNFFYDWKIDSLKLKPGEKLNYYFEVWDNDGVNGYKSTRSANYTFALPTLDALKADISLQQNSAEKAIDKSLQKAKDLKQSIDEAQEKLRGKQSLDWQNKKMLEDLLKQRQKLDQTINELQKENKLLEQKKDAFTQENERIKEKSQQIQKLINDLLDDETKKLFEELEKLLNENTDLQQIQKMLDKMDRKEINLEKELERTLSLFKQLQYDYKLDQAINEIKDQLKKQEGLLKKTEELLEKKNDPKINSPSANDSTNSDKKGKELSKEQEGLRNETQQFEKSVEDLKKMGEELNRNEEAIPSMDEVEQLEKSEQESEKSLNGGKPKESQEHQKKSLRQMKQIQQQLEGMQNTMEMEMDEQNLESLRQIVHGLIKLSFDQENLMKEFGLVQQADPKFVQISQNQLKLRDDSKVLEDSLLALSKKDPFMGSVVTKEIGELNSHLERAVLNMKERHKSLAAAEMQFSMTNFNNLALMLNDHFDMMMKMLSDAMPSKGKGKKGKNMPSLGKMQQQINDKIEQLKNGQKSGRQYSEDLARMAAEQERIRKGLREMEDKLKKEGGKLPGNDLSGKMEQSEFDLVNKNITEETIKRQKEILTRLLEAEKSMREQNQTEERKGETARNYEKEFPHAFEEYIRLKEKEVELLKTMPPQFFPYYKKEVAEYFKRIN